MESERDAKFDPRSQLRAYQEGSRAAEREAHVAAALWLWPAVSFVCPAIVAFRYLDGTLRIAVVALLALFIVPAMAIEIRRELAVRAKGRTPARGDRSSFWYFPALFCYILSLHIAGGRDWSSGLALAAVSYAISAIGATFFWHKADQALIEKTTAPVHL